LSLWQKLKVCQLLKKLCRLFCKKLRSNETQSCSPALGVFYSLCCFHQTLNSLTHSLTTTLAEYYI
jgi:hypothetical protein